MVAALATRMAELTTVEGLARAPAAIRSKPAPNRKLEAWVTADLRVLLPDPGPPMGSHALPVAA